MASGPIMVNMGQFPGNRGFVQILFNKTKSFMEWVVLITDKQMTFDMKAVELF